MHPRIPSEPSPAPVQEWARLLEVLGEDLLGALAGVPQISMPRYMNAERPIPEPVAARLDFTALVVADLLGSYNNFGVRRRFTRSRAQLHGKTPLEKLKKDWAPDDEGAKTVRQLASALRVPFCS